MATNTKKQTKIKEAKTSKPKIVKGVKLEKHPKPSLQTVPMKLKYVRMPVLLVILLGVIALGSLVYWRNQYISNQEYVEFPQPALRDIKQFSPAVK